MKSEKILLLVTLALTLSLISCSVSDSQKTSGWRVSLFDGKTLNGWTVIGCKAAVDKGDILIEDGNGLVQSQKQYANFVLEYEWKALKADQWDSGVYFRYTAVPAGRPWPERYQVNLRKGDEGNVGDLSGAKTPDLTKHGDWNRFKLTVNGTRASLEINGKPAWSADGLSGPDRGFIALQAEVPGGGQFRFRNIFITELE
ncbi:MAG: DUF1080 domain-containing protein [Phycisphaerae bacterium]|nr:DUF1080 domain-containing protein [Phycisphaerae bacterium]